MSIGEYEEPDYESDLKKKILDKLKDAESLKPCPFCGSPAKIMKGCGEDWVECVNPKCSCCSSMHTNTSVAIEIWNRRVKE